jgi:hypothetical protein
MFGAPFLLIVVFSAVAVIGVPPLAWAAGGNCCDVCLYSATRGHRQYHWQRQAQAPVTWRSLAAGLTKQLMYSKYPSTLTNPHKWPYAVAKPESKTKSEYRFTSDCGAQPVSHPRVFENGADSSLGLRACSSRSGYVEGRPKPVGIAWSRLSDRKRQTPKSSGYRLNSLDHSTRCQQTVISVAAGTTGF